MSATFPLPPAPDPVQIAKWAGQIRALLTLAAGLGATWLPAITDNQIKDDLTAGLTTFTIALWLTGAIWSWVEKIIQQRKANAMVVAAAVVTAHQTIKAGTPTPTIVVPAPTAADAGATASRIIGFAEEGRASDIVPAPTARYTA